MLSKTEHLLAILPRGEAIRNFVYTGILDTIDQNARLTVLSVNPDDDVWGLLTSRYPSVLELQSFPEHYLVRAIKEILDIAHGRWLWSEAAKERWRLRDLEASTFSKRAKRLLKKSVSLPFANRYGLRLLDILEIKASRYLNNTNYYLDLFQELKPTLVFNGSHIHSQIATPAIKAAKWLGIPTATFLFSWDNLTSQGRITLPYDYYLAWNVSIRDHLLDLYKPSIKADQVFVTGTPQFDFHFNSQFYWSREEFCERVGADPTRPIILYTTGMANHMPDEHLIVARIADMLEKMNTRPQLLVRVYPKDQSGRFDSLRQTHPAILIPPIPWSPKWLTPNLQDIPLLTNMLRHTDVGINVASTVSLELAMFDKPILNVGYNPLSVPVDVLDYAQYYNFDHYKPLVAKGLVKVAYSENELFQLLEEALANPGQNSPVRQKFLKEFFVPNLDGQAGNRISHVLLRLTNGQVEVS